MLLSHHKTKILISCHLKNKIHFCFEFLWLKICWAFDNFVFKFALILISFLLGFLVGEVRSSSSWNFPRSALWEWYGEMGTKDKNGNKYPEHCTFLVPADFNGGSLSWFSSRVCSAAHRIPLWGRWVGSGALGFFQVIYCSAAEAAGEAGCAPFPKSCGWSCGTLHAQLDVSGGSWARGDVAPSAPRLQPEVMGWDPEGWELKHNGFADCSPCSAFPCHAEVCS